jgi:hypothetical protein
MEFCSNTLRDRNKGFQLENLLLRDVLEFECFVAKFENSERD